jgi:hypothetical protein
MKPSPANPPPAVAQPAIPSPGRRPVILALVFLLLGFALAGFWFKYGKTTMGGLAAGQGGAGLSGQTREQLRQLPAPVEIRFYSILPPGSAPESLQTFSRRVDGLLSEFQSAGGDKIRVVRNLSTGGANADAAAVDGIRPFNLEKGDACFLGIAVVSGGQKESLPQLQPEWEPALEFDIVRAILRVTATPATLVAKASVPVPPEVTNDVVRLIPDFKNTSLDDGTRILREAAWKEFTDAGIEGENQIKAAQQKLSEAQSGGSEAEQQAAMKQLQQAQLEQAEKYKQIAARLQARLGVFEQLKAAGASTGAP